MPDQRCKKCHHHARDAGHLHQQPEEDEHRHGQQQQVGDALVHPVDHDGQRHVAGQAKIGQGGDAEGEGNRHADRHTGGDHHHEEHHQGSEAHRRQHRLRQPQPRGDPANHRDAEREGLRRRGFEQAHQCDQCGQRHADQDRRHAIAIGDAQRDQRYEALLAEILRGRQQDLQHERNHHQGGHSGKATAP
jgi:hypothetical protein